MIYKHLVIVHGIGDQLRNETSISFMSEFVRALPEAIQRTVRVHNLVERIGNLTEDAAEPAFLTCTIEKRDYVFAFSEVYWQPVTNGYLGNNDDNPPVPIFTWAHSINTRLLHGGPRFQAARDAIDNLEKMLLMLKWLAAINKKSDLLVKILEKFAGDVEMYVESRALRGEINGKFLAVLKNVGSMRAQIVTEMRERFHVELEPGQDTYIVAHSEGTVVSYNSLVQAAKEREADNTRYPWLQNVRALITLGSPLDKHYGIWDNRFRTDELTRLTELKPKIAWRNYWDRSDPVGYGLKKLFPDDGSGDAPRMFTVVQDAAFTRYPIPGKAHVDYWHDKEIHADILHEVVTGGPNASQVKDKPWRFLQAPADFGLYVLGRLATLGAFIFFANKLLYPLRKQFGFGWAPESWLPVILVLAGPIALNGLFATDREWRLAWLQKVHGFLWNLQVAWTETVEDARLLLTSLWVVVTGVLCVILSRFDKPMEIKDWIGYVGGLVVCVLVWRLQTTIHTGLLQMWRYTGGLNTSYSPPAVKA